MKFSLFSKKNDNSKINNFNEITSKQKKIVFYAENKASYNHLGPLINEFVSRNIPITYVTSVKDDRVFSKNNDLVQTLFVGQGISRINFFITLDANILITDMPDLEKFHIKRSRKHNVHYVYIFHSMFSTHSYLRKGALDHYDTIFCVGEHHIKEIRETEKIYKLKPKNLIKYGFPRLDELKKNSITNFNKLNNTVLICPSYGKNNLLLNSGMKLIKILLDNKFKVILRPHYRIFDENKEIINQIINEFSSHKNFKLEKNNLSYENFKNSVCMISDWSNISFEYAFVYFKPIIFIDVPMKNMNNDFQKLSSPPIEFEMREKIGYLLSPNMLETIPDLIDFAKNNLSKRKIEESVEKMIFNLGYSTKTGVDFLENFLDEKK